MARKKAEPKKPKPIRRQLGILFSEGLWIRLRMLALEQRRTGTELMEEAVREYLEKHEEKHENRDKRR